MTVPEIPPALSLKAWAKHLDGSAAIKRSGEMEIGLGVYAGISTDERWRAENDSLNYGTMPPFLILYWQTVCEEMAVYDPHKLAALCLHQQSFGFSRADVEALTEIATDLMQEAAVSEERVLAGETLEDRGLWGTNAQACRDRADKFYSLASRISALLPPEGTV